MDIVDILLMQHTKATCILVQCFYQVFCVWLIQSEGTFAPQQILLPMLVVNQTYI